MVDLGDFWLQRYPRFRVQQRYEVSSWSNDFLAFFISSYLVLSFTSRFLFILTSLCQPPGLVMFRCVNICSTRSTSHNLQTLPEAVQVSNTWYSLSWLVEMRFRVGTFRQSSSAEPSRQCFFVSSAQAAARQQRELIWLQDGVTPRTRSDYEGRKRLCILQSSAMKVHHGRDCRRG